MTKILNKTELIENIAGVSDIPKTVVAKVLIALIDEIKTSEKVTISGFGKFEVKKRAGRTGHNPHTGKPLQIPEKTVLRFSPSGKLWE